MKKTRPRNDQSSGPGPDRLRYFESRIDSLLQTICEFVEIESPSDNKPAADRMAAFLAERFALSGGRPHLHRAERFGDNLQIDFPGSANIKPVLLLGHFDTVYPLGTLSATMTDAQASVTHDSLPKVRMRHGQIEHLFQNLIGNAIKYRRDEEPPCIHISVVPSGENWRFGVHDNGIGIAPEYKEKVFGIFQRLHTEKKYSGAGIGLAICQRVVERYGGRIWVESEAGRGATFYFTLPAELDPGAPWTA